jgi:hypothetical protein
VPTRRKVPIQKMVPRTVLVPVTVHVEQVHMETESRTIQVLPPALSLNPRSSRAAHNPPPPACVGCCGLALESVSGPARPDAETVRGRNLQIKGQGGWRAGGWGRVCLGGPGRGAPGCCSLAFAPFLPLIVRLRLESTHPNPAPPAF